MYNKLEIKNMIKKIVQVAGLICVFGFLLLISQADASKFYFTTSDESIGINGEVEVSLFIDSDGSRINAVEGMVSLPEHLVDIIQINYGESIVDIWIQKPKVTKDGIVFSGIVPGGFDVVHDPVESRKKSGKILTFILQSKKEGSIPVILENISALLNDGNGSSDNVTSVPLYIEVLSYQGSPIDKDLFDTKPPEEFIPEVVQDKNIFNGKYFLVFHTQDKSSGVDYYEIKEGKKEWVIAESPYELTDQSLISELKIKAVDKYGNEKIEVLRATYPQVLKYKNYFWGIIIVLAMFYLFLIKRKFKFNRIK